MHVGVYKTWQDKSVAVLENRCLRKLLIQRLVITNSQDDPVVKHQGTVWKGLESFIFCKGVTRRVKNGRANE
jgi:hypothetical protein